MSWRVLDLFSGLAGFTLAAHEVWADELEPVSFVEIDKRCREFLSRAWPGVPIHEDIKTLDASKWLGTIDLLTGGVPCQPASRAGKQRGKEDDRWLWDQALRVCEECLPTWALFENPPGIGDVGLDGILSALERIGYEVQTVDIPACSVGAPQLRHRYFIICWLENPSSSRSGSQPGQIGGQRRQSMDPRTENMRCGERQTCSNGVDPTGAYHSHMAHLCSEGCEERGVQPGIHGCQDAGDQRATHSKDPQGHMANPNHSGHQPERKSEEWLHNSNTKGNLADTKHGRWREHCESSGKGNADKDEGPRPWSSSVLLSCADGKVRRSPDDTQRMDHGLPVELLEILGEEGREDWSPEDCEPHRSLLGALGNSIVPQVAIEILEAIKEASR